MPALREARCRRGASRHHLIVVGGVTRRDWTNCTRQVRAAIFPPGTVIADLAVELIGELADGPRPSSWPRRVPGSMGAGEAVMARRPIDVAALTEECSPTGFHLARAITLVESTRPDHRQAAQESCLALTPHAGKSFRVGITGNPGVRQSPPPSRPSGCT